METRVIVTGSREWYCPELCIQVTRRMLVKWPDLLIAVGDCPSGVDRGIKRAATLQGVPYREYRAEWSRYGLRAGPIRNEAMVSDGGLFCLAIHNQIHASKGTKDCVKQAFRAGIPCYLYDNDREVDPIELTRKFIDDL